MEPGKEKVAIAASGTARLVIALILAMWLVLGVLPPSRPEPVPANAPAAAFSSERAMAHVHQIAQRPHPVGSADHDRVRDYIRAQFSRLGLKTSVQSGVGSYRGDSSRVENIVARLAGTDNTRPVMLVAHYDSVPRGPGAGDDGHAVAALIETLRALRSAPPLRNDVIFLITDGEELGMLGADLFVKEHPWRNESAVVLNFEARGTGGQSTMFETSDGNEWLVRELQAAVPDANATSLGYEVYKRMPNDTDLSVFKRAGLAGMNFAFIDHAELYHSRFDDPSHLDLRSLQEQGTYALALARRFGAMDLHDHKTEDAVYFPWRLSRLVVYGDFWVKPFAWATLLALAAGIGVAVRRRTRGLVMGGLLAIPAAVLLWVAGVAPGASYVIQWPLAGGVLAYLAMVTAPRVVGMDWRLLIFAITPAPAFLLVAAMLRPLLVALGPRAVPVVVVSILLIVVCVLPQIILLTRKTRHRSLTVAAR
jgi:hypothetical protein